MTDRLSVSLRAVSVRRGVTWALRNISLDLQPGERWALIGGNGAGKTQLLKLLGTDVWPTPTGREALVYRAGRRELAVVDAKRHFAYVGAELQDKYARYGWNLRLTALLATGLHGTDLLLQPPTAAEHRRVASALRLTGLTALGERTFLSLSYGQKRLALLARALIQRPDWLLLDELYNGLDALHRRRIDAVLERVAARGQSWVAAAHRAADVPRGTFGLMELRAGRLVAVRRLRRADLARLVDEARESRLTRAVAPRAGTGTSLVRIEGADLYVDYRLVLRDLNWRLRAGEQWAVFGANGSGKSSFLKLIYGDLAPAVGGVIERSGCPRGTPISRWKRGVGYVSPELQSDYGVNVSVRELVASGCHASIGLCEPPSDADINNAMGWLDFFSLRSMAERRPCELSYGQMRRALIARALAAAPRIVLLDEPLTGLDPRQRAAMKALFERLMRRGLTLVIAVHHPEDLPRGMTHLLHLHKRRASAQECQSAT